MISASDLSQNHTTTATEFYADYISGVVGSKKNNSKNNIISPIGKPPNSLMVIRGWRVKKFLTNSGEISLSKHIAHAASACENHS